MNKARKIVYTLSYLGIIIASLASAQAMMRARSSEDPLAHINYRDAFDQKAMHIKFKPLMKALKCGEENIFAGEPPKTQKPSPCCPSLRSQYEEHIDIDSTTFEDAPEWIDYKNKCLTKLQKARRWTIMEQARESASTIVLLGGAVSTVTWLLGSNSYGGGIAVFAGLFNSVFFIREIIGDTYNLINTPSHPLDEHEKKFAVNQCFIPKDLWPALITNFMTARQNPFAQQKSMNFIEFTLGLTTYRPKPPLKLDKNIDDILEELSTKIDTFFEDYNEIENQDEYYCLKTNIFKFVKSLLKKDKLSRYIYLHGPGGIGKTHFTHQLYKWLKEITNKAINKESFVINSTDELEGSDNKPGVFLRVLRNQCTKNKSGSVVLMDEADWLNKKDMISSAKRVFNGNLAKISTTYFGSGVDGTGMQLEIPPMLVIIASNGLIEDGPLKSRFDTLSFPSPKKQTLITYGQRLLKENISKLCEEKISLNGSGIIVKKLQDCKNFRDVEAIVPALVTQSLYPNRRKLGEIQ